tara:strand:+ start:500 stop:988 length:489 start_codon:yes stop_codon:yes gene_type:complete
MDIKKKVSVTFTQDDLFDVVKETFPTTNGSRQEEQFAKLITELLLDNSEACNIFFKIKFNTDQPLTIHNEGDSVKVQWKRLSIGLDNANAIYKQLQKNKLLSENDEVDCIITKFRGLIQFFSYDVKFTADLNDNVKNLKFQKKKYYYASLRSEDVEKLELLW